MYMRRTKVLLLLPERGIGAAERDAIVDAMRAGGFELLDSERPGRPDVVLLELPGSSRERLAMLKRVAPLAAPIVVMSADASILPREARAIGAWGWIARPMPPDVLRARLRDAARAWQRHPSLFGLSAFRER